MRRELFPPGHPTVGRRRATASAASLFHRISPGGRTRKLKLDLEHLAVESFATATDTMQWGTIRAASDEPVEEPTVVEEEAGFLSWFTCQTRCNQNTCGRTCATCYDPTCDSCYITKCKDNCA